MSDVRSLRAQRGAVNAMWLIVVMILWIMTLGLLYYSNDDIAAAQEAERAAREGRQLIESRFDALNADYQALSEVVGFRDASIQTSKSDVASIRAQIESIKTTLGSVVGGDGSEPRLSDVVTALVAAHQAAKTSSRDAQAGFEREQAARQAADEKVAQVETTYRDQVGQLQQQLSEEQDRADNQARADQQTIADLTAQQKAADDRARSVQQELEDNRVTTQRSAALAQATIKSLEVRREPPEPEQPDGEVLAVSDGGAVGWIDVGGRDGLKRGTRFELLRRGRAGLLEPRGTVEVRDVEGDMALVGLLGDPNPFDPMLAGDLVRNPHFAKGQSLRFYLLGEFPLTLSKEFVTQRLVELGGKVDETLTASTDVLVLGEKNLAEGEFATELVDTDEYKLADSLGMRIIRLDDLSTYLRY